MATAETHYTLPLPTFDKPVKLLIVVAPYYKDIADNLVAGARAVGEACGAEVDLVEVPGALEIPTSIAMAQRLADYDAFVALGCVIRGETSHYDYVCAESARALQDIAVSHQVALGYGILTVENGEQAWERARMSRKNKGGDVARACLAMIDLKHRLAKSNAGGAR